MSRKLRIKLWSTTAAAAQVAGRALYNPEPGIRADPFSIPAEYARIFYPAMYLLWAVALATQIVELYWGTGQAASAESYPPWVSANADAATFLIRFGSLAFALTLLLIPATIIIVNLGRLLMSLAKRIDDWFLPKHVKAEIEAASAAAAAAAAATAAAETRLEVNAQWNSWLSRRDAALAQGKNFNEPPPSDQP